MAAVPLRVGEPAPWFTCRTLSRQRFVFDTIAGRHVVISFMGSAAHPVATRLLEDLHRARARFDHVSETFFGVTCDPRDQHAGRIADLLPGMRFILDFEREASTLYGAAQPDGTYRPITYVLDPSLRVLAAFPFKAGAPHAHELLAFLDTLPRAAPPQPAPAQAPVLVLPRVFEPELCATLIGYYESRGGYDSGFMREVDGKTVPIIDYSHKRRRDCDIEDEALRLACMARIHDRLAPELRKAFQFNATRIERYMVACYDAAEAAHFRPHRDNTTKGTAHRRFAVSLFLNSGEYEGGKLRFPEFGPALHSAPAGGAVVFSCSLLHEATPVTSGRRFMFLPFLYDEEAALIREKNQKYLALSEAPAEQ